MRVLRLPSSERGASLITAVSVSFVMLALVALMFTQVVHTNQVTGADRRRVGVFHVAEAGIDEAVARLALNPAFSGSAAVPVTAAGETVGTYTTTVVDPGPGVTSDRVIVSTGTLTSGSEGRTIRQSVRIVPLGGFDYALFSASGMALSNRMNLVGSTYSRDSTTLANDTTITGDLTSPENITTSNRSTINGDVWSGGNVVISTGTTVTGNVLASGSVTIQNNAKVNGDVRAASIVNNGTIVGQQVLSSQPSPALRTLPSYLYNPLDYQNPPGPPVETTSAGFQACWQTGIGCPVGVSRTAMHGVYHMADGGTLTGPNLRTTLNGDLIIISNGPIVIQRDFITATSGTYRLVIITTSASISPAAITWTNNVSTPPNIETFVYAVGKVDFQNLKTFSGIVYAGDVETDQNFTLTYTPSLRDYVKGFTWDLSSAGAYEVKPLTWEECVSPSC